VAAAAFLKNVPIVCGVFAINLDLIVAARIAYDLVNLQTLPFEFSVAPERYPCHVGGIFGVVGFVTNLTFENEIAFLDPVDTWFGRKD